MEFSTELNREDIATMQDAIKEWESAEDSFLDFIGYLRQVGDPPQEFLETAGEGFLEAWTQFKSEMLGREQKAKDTKVERQEQATLLNTKFILMKRKMMDNLADDLFYGDPEDGADAPKETPPEAPEAPKDDSSTKSTKPTKPRQIGGKDKDKKDLE